MISAILGISSTNQSQAPAAKTFVARVITDHSPMQPRWAQVCERVTVGRWNDDRLGKRCCGHECEVFRRMKMRADSRTRRRFLHGLTATGWWRLPLQARRAASSSETAPPPRARSIPDKLPLDTDNDLLILNDAITPAVGEITHLTGHVVTKSGQPLRNAFVEIWQVDHNG